MEKTVIIPAYYHDRDIFFVGTDEEIDAVEKVIADRENRFRDIVENPDFNALEYWRDNRHMVLSRSTDGDFGAEWRITYFLDGVINGKKYEDYATMHENYYGKSQGYKAIGVHGDLFGFLAGACYGYDITVNII